MMLLQAGQLGLYRRDSIWTEEIPPEMVSGATLWLDFTDTDWNYADYDQTGGHVTADGGQFVEVVNKVDPNYVYRLYTPSHFMKLKSPATPISGPAAVLGNAVETGAFYTRMLDTSTNTDAESSVFVGASSKTIFAVVRVPYAQDYGWSQPYLFDRVFGSDYFSLGFTDNGVDLRAHAYTWVSDVVATSVVIPRDTYVVLTMNHQSGALRIRVNGGSWASVACGATASLAASCGSMFSPPLAGHIEVAHIAAVRTVQADGAISAVEHWLANDLGITPWW